VRRLEAEPTWTGERKEGSGRKRATTPAEDQAMVRAVKKFHGERRVNAVTLRKLEPAAKKVGTRTLRRRLRESELRWCRRRRKTVIPAESVTARLEWARWLKRQSAAYLRRMTFTDGVSFYLGRTDTQHANAQRAALGLFVYRETTSQDALYKDCVGPSSYAKAQGECVRMWGLLRKGQLHARILLRGTVMNRWEYEHIIRTDFARWLSRDRWPLLVQDHERALWCQGPMEACAQTGIQVVEQHPKHSADLNIIENVWSLLRSRLDDTMPAEPETRADFVQRLRSAIFWVNRNHKETMLKWQRDYKQRAHDVLENNGHRAKW